MVAAPSPSLAPQATAPAAAPAPVMAGASQERPAAGPPDGRGSSERTPSAADWGDPRDYDSRWWEHMRLCGVGPGTLAAYDVQLCNRPDERKPHPAQCPRLYYRYPVWDEDLVPLNYRLAAVDGEQPRSRWEWEWLAQPDLIYEPVGIVRGAPLLVVGDVLGVWVLHSVGLVACTFLCPPSSAPPGRALAQIAAAGPSSVLVVDNERPSLPGGPLAIARALRAAGVPAGYARLRVRSALPGLLGGATMVDVAREHGGDREAVRRALAALSVERAS